MVEGDSTQAMAFRLRMVNRLSGLGYLPHHWRNTLLEIPRQVFTPDVVWHPTPQGYFPLCSTDDPASWLDLVHRDDEPLVAQVDHGTPHGLGQQPTSTVLALTDLTWLLKLLPTTPGLRVCVVGAGLGYLTALLAHHHGVDAVAAVEIDPGIAEDCRQRLDTVGLRGVQVLTADGTRELPDGPPFDLILSTVIVRHIPGEWLRRVRPGGVIITNHSTGYAHDHTIRLTVHNDQHATGQVIGEIDTDWARGQRPQHTLTTTEVHLAAAGADHTTFDVHYPPRTRDIEFAIGARVPNCVQIRVALHDDIWLIDPTSGSRTHWHRTPTGRHRVDHYGPRNLWNEIHQAHHWWTTHHQPQPHHWTITTTPHSTTLQLPDLAATGVK